MNHWKQVCEILLLQRKLSQEGKLSVVSESAQLILCIFHPTAFIA
jgi:hypothetical protein